MSKRRGFGRIRKLPSGRYQASYVGPDTRRHNAPTTFQTKGDAEGWLHNRQNEIRDGEWLPGKVRREAITLRAFADRWLEDRRKADGSALAPRTKAHYRTILDDFILPELGDHMLKSITPETVDEWYAALDTGPTYKAHSYSLLRTIFGTAIERHRSTGVLANPCAIRGASNAKRAHNPEPASLDELTVITERMPPRYQAMVLLAAWTGLRFGELTGLTRGDINQKSGVVNIRRGITWVDGKAVVGPPKSEAGRRSVAIPPHLMPMLKDHLRDHVGKSKDSLLFPAKSGGYMRPATLYRVYYPARDAAGRPDLHFHDLRHTGATMAGMAGATLAELMRRLGHSSQRAALIYQHSSAERDAAIARRLSDFANGFQ